jgi:hypothetical protein
MNSEHNIITNTSRQFRIRSKRFFLTYPKVIDLPDLEQLFLQAMQSIFGIIHEDKMSYIIVRELHEDGTPHIHIYLEFQDKQSIYSRDKLHVCLRDKDGKDAIHQGKYESVRNKDLVIEYILKDSNNDYLTNIILPLVKNIIYTNPEEHLFAILESEGYDAATNALVTQYKSLAAKKGATIIRNLRALNEIIWKRSYKQNNNVRDINEFRIPPEVLDWKDNSHNKTALIIWGPSGTCKTEFTKSLLKSMNLETLLIRNVNALKDVRIETNTALLFDDISLAGKTREELIHYFDLENGTQLRVLYSIVDIPPGTPRAFTTNRINRVIGSVPVPAEIARRITIVSVPESLKLSLKRTTTVIEKIEIE